MVGARLYMTQARIGFGLTPNPRLVIWLELQLAGSPRLAVQLESGDDTRVEL